MGDLELLENGDFDLLKLRDGDLHRDFSLSMSIGVSPNFLFKAFTFSPCAAMSAHSSSSFSDLAVFAYITIEKFE